MKPHTEIWAEVRALAEARGMEFKFKTDSSFMKLLNLFVGRFNKRFMSNFTTTIGNTIYFPSEDWLFGRDFVTKDNGTPFTVVEQERLGAERAWKVVAHEIVHYDDGEKIGQIPYSTWYLFPQIPLFVIGLVLGFVLGPWLFLTALSGLIPFPAPGRKYYEMRGYAVSMAVLMWSENRALAEPPDYIVKSFTTGNYYWMWPFKAKVEAELKDWIARAQYLQIFVEIPVSKSLHAIIG